MDLVDLDGDIEDDITPAEDKDEPFREPDELANMDPDELALEVGWNGSR